MLSTNFLYRAWKGKNALTRMKMPLLGYRDRVRMIALDEVGKTTFEHCEVSLDYCCSGVLANGASALGFCRGRMSH